MKFFFAIFLATSVTQLIVAWDSDSERLVDEQSSNADDQFEIVRVEL